jgi:hypothetical protein
MTKKQPSDKIHWVLYDFDFSGLYKPKTGETEMTTTVITHSIIEEYMIEFSTEAYDYEGINLSYNVHLLIDDTGRKYVGRHTRDDKPESEGEVTCELYSNSKTYFLYGKWTEDGKDYTWWARIEKKF